MVKRSFYEMFGLPHDAKQEQIAAAYARCSDRLSAVNRRGASETTIEARLLLEGYQILSDPAKRATYDAKLAAAESGVQLMFFPANYVSRRKLGLQTIIFAALAAAFWAIIYYQLARKMDEVHVKHVQAINKVKEEQAREITVEMTNSDTVVAISTAKGNK